MLPGETPCESACRILKRELKMEMEPKRLNEGGRFIGVGAYSYAWEFRQQSPQNNGTADVSLVFCVRLTTLERSKIRLDYASDKEYHGHAWVMPSEIIKDKTKHPALRRAVADLVAGEKWRSIRSVASTLSNEELGMQLRMSGLLEDYEDVELRGG
jgi:hypothetical protein